MTTTLADSSGLMGGKLLAVSDTSIVLGLGGTDYQLHLVTVGRVQGAVGDNVRGVIRAKARRVDVVGTGGRFIEPVYGRPRRLQGTVVGVDTTNNNLTVDCICRFVCELGVGQQAGDFKAGSLVGFDVESGSLFESVG